MTFHSMTRQIWDIRIKEAMKRGRFLKKDKKDSENWKFCSVGERDIIPKFQRYKELLTWIVYNLSDETTDLGALFFKAVYNDDIKGAKKFHEKIKTIPKGEM